MTIKCEIKGIALSRPHNPFVCSIPPHYARMAFLPLNIYVCFRIKKDPPNYIADLFIILYFSKLVHRLYAGKAEKTTALFGRQCHYADSSYAYMHAAYGAHGLYIELGLTQLFAELGL